jgi:DNA replication protein DnaC
MIPLQSSPLHFSRISLPEEFGGIQMSTLSFLKDHPEHEAMQLVDCVCSKCGAPIQAIALFASLTACDPCREKWEREQRENVAIEHWRKICPPSFEDTDVTHAGFPRAQFDLLADYLGTESLIFLGETGTGKTRLAMLMLRRCLFQRKAYVGVLWPEELKASKWTKDHLGMIQKWAIFDLLLFDDSLLTGAQDERIAEFLKDLLEVRARSKKPFILTTQIGGDEVKDQAAKFGDITAADLKRIEALNRRITETARMIPFLKKTAGDASAF